MRRLGVLLLCALALPVASARAWTWPLDGQVLRGFDFDRAHPYAGGQHRGIDIAASVGAPVLAPAEGVVSFAGTVPTGGKTISIQTPFGKTVTLQRLGSLRVTRGQTVGEGSAVASAGPSTDAELPDPHVYLGIRTTADPQGYLDPLTFLPARAVVPGTSPSAAPAVDSAVDPAVDPAPAEAAATTVAPAAVADPAPGSEISAADTAAADTASEGSASSSVTAPQPLARAEAGSVDAVASTSSVTGRVAASPDADLAAPEADAHSSAPASGRSVEPVPSAGAAMSHEAAPHDPRLEMPTTGVRNASGRGGGMLPVAIGASVLVALLAVIGTAFRRRRARPETVRMMDLLEPESAVARNDTEERPRRAGLAVCVGATAPRSRGGVRGARGHLRALPPPEREPRLDGERDGRARHAGDGDGGQGRRLAA